MRSSMGRRIIRPKLTMPRQENAATAYLQIYQLVVEKNRLKEELRAIENRQFHISKRLELITKKIDLLEKIVHEMDDDLPPKANKNKLQKAQPSARSQTEKKSAKTDSDPGYSLETMTLDY